MKAPTIFAILCCFAASGLLVFADAPDEDDAAIVEGGGSTEEATAESEGVKRPGNDFDPRNGLYQSRGGAYAVGAMTERVSLAFDADARYDSNIDLLPEGHEVSGFTYTFSPDVMVRLLGSDASMNLLALAYSPTLLWDDDRQDLEVDQDISALYAFNGSRLDLSITGSYTHISGNNVPNLNDRRRISLLREERRAESDRYHVGASLVYDLSGMVDIEAEAGWQDVGFAEELNDNSSVAGNLAFIYGEEGARTRIGPYVGYESLDATNQPDQDAFQYGARIYWDYSAVTSIFLQIAGESREYDGPGATGSDSNIVWAAGANWSPNPRFDASLSYSRIVEPSLTSAGENYLVDSISLALRKQIFSHYFVNLGGGYSHSEYESTTGGGGTDRVDDYFTGYAELGRELGTYGDIAVFYSYLDNDSTLFLNTFQGHSVGVKLGVEF